MIDRTLELMLYVASKSPKNTVYWVLKAIYYADRNHLLKFGRRIHKDVYIAMPDGPVPSHGYDLFKNVRDQRESNPSYGVADGQFDVAPENQIVPLREPKMEIFSASDIQCLDESIGFVSAMSFPELRDASHDGAWESASANGQMKMEDIITAMEGGAEAWPYLRERMLA